MSDHNLAEALRLIAWSNDSAWRAQCAREALAAHEAEQQAGEAVAVVYSISGQSRTEDAYATVQILNSAGNGCWDLPVRVGTKLFTRPQQPLTDEQIAKIEAEIWNVAWLDETEQQSNREFARAIQRELGITKDTK